MSHDNAKEQDRHGDRQSTPIDGTTPLLLKSEVGDFGRVWRWTGLGTKGPFYIGRGGTK